MPEIQPFRAIRYNPETAGDAAKLICPPYDVIAPSMQEELYGSSPYNAIRLELPMEADPYGAAAERLEEWLRSDVLVREEEPAIYPYSQTFTDLEGNTHTRCGFFAAMRLHEFAEKKVLPHERTLSGPKADRLNLFRKTRTNISSIFGLYADEEAVADRLVAGYAETREPLFDAVFQGVRNRLWRIVDPELVEGIQQALAQKSVYIADGHHRYETGLNYLRERAQANPEHTGNEPYNFILVYLNNIYDKGLVVFPIHRLVHSLENFDASRLRELLEEQFAVTDLDGRAELKAYLEAASSSYAYGVVTTDYVLGITLKGDPAELIDGAIAPALRRLGLVVLHEVVLARLLGIGQEAMAKQSNLVYVKDDGEVFDAVASGRVQAGFVVKPVTVQQVLAVSESGGVMPQKSTFFYPKIMTGLVFNPLD
ncbi:MAG: DUF1015 domain-containing protein [Chlorobium sp.]|uniref:DUF1015 domain-containing protein n=1 Tax=Chlorobium sp. TaxID=1095 RepID=UPI0025C6FAF9|nr:DUF1015 domain-containing protein [Chlorobium sp.]MCF8382313.1 DUF1015 domain-containing protein [Chlorobium sp.]